MMMIFVSINKKETLKGLFFLFYQIALQPTP